jgi:hypothetical protein
MAEQGERIRVVFRSIQIHDAKDLDGEGEFRFTARVTVRSGGAENVEETKLPRKKKFYRISDNQAWNRLTLDETLYEGPAGDEMEVEILGEEVDLFKKNDELERYHRMFSGPVSGWIGVYRPGDEGSEDPERMKSWWVFLEVEKA